MEQHLVIVGSALGLLAVLLAAVSVVRTGPAALVAAARGSALLGLVASGAGTILQLVAQGGASDPRARGAGLLPAAGLLFTTFAATRVAQRRIDARTREEARRKREAPQA